MVSSITFGGAANWCSVLDCAPRLKPRPSACRRSRLANTGALQEWNEDYAETEPGYRHIGHLLVLYPDHQITLRETPDLAKAARAVLDAVLAPKVL